MPDKPKAKQAAKRKSATPPQEPTQDYSSLPQKPIMLKSDVSLPPALKRSTGKSRPATQVTPKPVKKAKRKPPSQVPKLLDGVSEQAREAATSAAAEAGMDLTTWLEKLILNSQYPAEERNETGYDEILLSLQLIEQRLERLENQRGFWSRFWEQFMEPQRRKP
jgi:hypothetical protein